MTISAVQDALDAPWWAELLSVKDTSSWAALSQRFGASANTLRAALAASGHSKAPMAAGRKPKASKGGAAGPAKPAVVVVDPLSAVRSRIGTVPDAEVAALAGVVVAQVKAYRREHGIEAFKQAPPSATPARQKAGERDTTVVRRRFGAAPVVVQSPAPVAVPLEVPLKVSTPIVAAPKARTERPRRTAAAPAPVKGRPGRRSVIDAFAQLLGTVTDAEIAAKANVTVAAVTQYRIRRGIVAANRRPALAEAAAAPAGVRHRRSKLDAYAHLVGTLSDAEVALLADVTSEGVRQYRRRHGIPSAFTTAASVRVAPAAPAPVAPARVAAAPVVSAPVVSASVVSAPVVSAPVAPAPVAPAPVAPAPVAVEPAPSVSAAAPQAYGVMATHGGVSRRFVVVGTDLRESLRRAAVALAQRADGPWEICAIRILCDAVG
jgi:hypothetical protein